MSPGEKTRKIEHACAFEMHVEGENGPNEMSFLKASTNIRSNKNAILRFKFLYNLLSATGTIIFYSLLVYFVDLSHRILRDYEGHEPLSFVCENSFISFWTSLHRFVWLRAQFWFIKIRVCYVDFNRVYSLHS